MVVVPALRFSINQRVVNVAESGPPNSFNAIPLRWFQLHAGHLCAGLNPNRVMMLLFKGIYINGFFLP